MTRRARGSGPTVRKRATFVVLAGGESRRMGRDKAFLPVGGREMLDRLLDVGRSACGGCVVVAGEADAHAEALRRYGWREAETAPASGGDDGSGPTPSAPGAGRAEASPGSPTPGGGRRFRRDGVGLRLVTDRHPGRGPVAGLEAGLEAADGPLAFVAACDLPFLSARAVTGLLRELEALAEHAGAGPGDRRLAVVPVADGRRQPLAAAYTAGCAPAARRCVEEGELAMASLLERLEDVRTVPARSVARAGHPEPARLFTNVNRPEQLRAARRRARAGGRAEEERP